MTSDVILEITRGIRFHYSKFNTSLGGGAAEKAMLGLGHSYSRAHVKFNVNRKDNMIIQAICILDQVDAWRTSDADRQGPEHVLDACEGVVRLALPRDAKDRCVSALQQVVLDEDVARDIMNAGRASMGQELNQMDLVSVNLFADK